MKVAVSTIVILFLSVNAVHAQYDSSLLRSWSVAVVANEYGYDSGLGLELGSPGFLNGRLSVRLKASTVWMESYRAIYDHWARFQLVEAMAIYQFNLIDRARPYIEVGLIEVFPSGKFSDITSVQGVGVRTGFELFVYTSRRLHVACYFGGGINQVNAVAEKLESHPVYADGFVFMTGLRFYVPDARRLHRVD